MKLPSRPKLVYVERKEDTRKFCIVPFRACLDDSLTRTELITLMLLASYSSPNGYSFVALSTMANIRGVKPQNISKYIKRLEAKGYVETVRKGYTNLRGALRRILFEPKLTELEQVSISNDNNVKVYDMDKHIQKRGRPRKQSEGDNSMLSYDEAVLAISHSLKTESDLLKLERLVSSGVSRSQLIAAFAEGA